MVGGWDGAGGGAAVTPDQTPAAGFWLQAEQLWQPFHRRRRPAGQKNPSLLLIKKHISYIFP